MVFIQEEVESCGCSLAVENDQESLFVDHREDQGRTSRSKMEDDIKDFNLNSLMGDLDYLKVAAFVILI